MNTQSMPTGQLGMELKWYTSGNAFLSTSPCTLTGLASGWVPKSCALTAPAKAARARVRLYTTKGSGQAYVDAVKLEASQP
jgi:hypothetical protein